MREKHNAQAKKETTREDQVRQIRKSRTTDALALGVVTSARIERKNLMAFETKGSSIEKSSE